MRRSFFIALFILPLCAAAQYRITGKIIDSADKKPIPGASVFLSNASVGTATVADGTFTLENVRGGQYDLVISMLGFGTYKKTLLITDNISLPPVTIAVKVNSIKEVNVHPDPEWERNYETFRAEFLGRSDYAKACKILNPELLDIQSDTKTHRLLASSSDYIIIENKALGYRVKYMLNVFEHNYKTNILYFAGDASFENVKGTIVQQRKWEKARLKVYKGSSMHFLRDVIANDLKDEGFEVRRLIRAPNPQAQKNVFVSPYLETLIKRPLLTAGDFTSKTDKKGLFALVYKDCLHVSYGSHDPTNIILTQPYALFDNNGIFTDPSAELFEGAWGKSRIAEMLPVDYEPPQK